jgi:hypothetical protein
LGSRGKKVWGTGKEKKEKKLFAPLYIIYIYIYISFLAGNFDEQICTPPSTQYLVINEIGTEEVVGWEDLIFERGMDVIR